MITSQQAYGVVIHTFLFKTNIPTTTKVETRKCEKLILDKIGIKLVTAFWYMDQTVESALYCFDLLPLQRSKESYLEI